MAAAAAASSVLKRGAVCVEHVVGDLFIEGIKAAFPTVAVPDALITPGKKFADLQCNNSMALAKALSMLTPPVKKSPKEVGDEIIRHLPENDVVLSAETTPQGFINILIKKEWVCKTVRDVLDTGVLPPVVEPKRILVDFSSPNIAKEMHVGHLRSTIIGESFARLFEFLGHEVKRINHVGDWGTQFGMLIMHLKKHYPDWQQSPPNITDLVKFYRAAKEEFDADAEFKEAARLEVVKLQRGDPENTKAWKMLCDISRVEFEEIYSRLNVTLEERGESFYNDLIPKVLAECTAAGLVEESEGAKIIYSTQELPVDKLTEKDLSRLMSNLVVVQKSGAFTFDPVLLSVLRRIKVLSTNEAGEEVLQISKKEAKPLAKFDTQKDTEKLAASMAPLLKPTLDGELLAFFQAKGLVSADGAKIKVPRFPIPLMVVKSDGGYTYDSTDLAGFFHRLTIEKHDRLVIVTDVGQFDHFKMCAQVAEDMGWFAGGKTWQHGGFGLVTGADGKKLKTRSGETVKLKELLDEAVDRSYENLKEREAGDQKQGHTDEEMKALAKTIGFGAIKYFDLKQNRVSDYGFSFEKVLDFSGNTAVFLLYSYARIRSIQRKAGVEDIKALAAKTEMVLEHDSEKALGLAALKFGPVLLKTSEDLMPKNIADFVYELVGCVSDFYKDCRVIGHPLQDSRVLLLEVVALTIKQALNLLGIDVAERL